MNIVFVTSFKKTLLFYAVAKQLEAVGVNCFWISPSNEWEKWLIKKRVDSAKILNIAKLWSEEKKSTTLQFDNLNKIEKKSNVRINNIILSDRNLSKKSVEYSKKYFEMVSKKTASFLLKNDISYVFCEITWGFEQIISMVCSYLNIYCLQPHTIRIPTNRFAFFKDNLCKEIFEFNKKDKKRTEKKNVMKIIENYRKERPKPKYLAINNKIPKINLKMLFNFFRHLCISSDETKMSTWTLVKDRVRTTLNAKMIRFVSFENNPDIEKNYVLVTLHKQPEASIDIYGGCYTNQYENIEKISRSVKNDTLVYVKEHSNAIGDRSLFWYKRLGRLPNVILLSPYLNSFDLMGQAKAVISVSGTVCFEAAMMGVPAFTFADIFFGKVLAGSNINYNDLKKILNLEKCLLDNYVKDDEELSDFIQYLVSNSFEGFIASPSDDPDCISEENIKSVTKAFLGVLNI